MDDLTRRIFIGAAGAAASASVGSNPATAAPPAPVRAEPSEPSPKAAETVTPIIAIHGGYTSKMNEDEKTVQARRDSIALIIAQTEDFINSRKPNGEHPDAAETARYAVELLEKSQIFNAGIGPNSDGEPRRTVSLMAGGDDKSKISASVEAAPGILDRIKQAGHLLRKPKKPESVKLKYMPLPQQWDDMPAEIVKDTLKAKKATQGDHRSKGTVGCVVLDHNGRYAAATSTGGVGDSGTSAGNFASERGAVSMTGDGEGIVALGMASGLVQMLDFTTVDKASTHMFQKAHDHHVSSAAIFIGKGEGDKEVQVRCTDADAAMVFAYSKGDGQVHVFKNNKEHYYDDAAGPNGGLTAETKRQLKKDHQREEYAGFAKVGFIGQQRDTIDYPMTPEKCAELEDAVNAIKNSPRYRPVPIIPRNGVKVVEVAQIGEPVNMAELITKAREVSPSDAAKGGR